MKIGLIKAKTHYQDNFSQLTDKTFEDRTDLIIESANKFNLEILMAPEWYYSRPHPFTRLEKDKILYKISQNVPKTTLTIPGTFIWVYKETKDQDYVRMNFYNSAQIILNGFVQEYHKYEFGKKSGEITIEYLLEKATGDSFKATAGLKKGKFFNWRNFDVGLEICLDHGEGCLKSQEKNLDLQLVVACGCSFYEANSCIKDKGLVIVCDGFQDVTHYGEPLFNRVFQKNINQFNELEKADSTKHLDIYEI